jgi:CRP-like cAMP-binding protein
VDGNRVAEAGPHTLIGEAALEYKQKRKASVIAITRCKCLAIYKADYDSAVSLFKSQQKQLNQNILRRLYVIGGWNIIKIKGFSRILNEI